MKPVPSVDDLTFFLKRFAPRIVVRVSPNAIVAASSGGELHVPATISFDRERGTILGIGDDRIDDVNASTVRLFSAAALALAEYESVWDKFLRLIIQRAARRGLMLRPVIIVEGLNSLPRDVSDRARQAFIRALAKAGAAAVVVDPAMN